LDLFLTLHKLFSNFTQEVNADKEGRNEKNEKKMRKKNEKKKKEEEGKKKDKRIERKKKNQIN